MRGVAAIEAPGGSAGAYKLAVGQGGGGSKHSMVGGGEQRPGQRRGFQGQTCIPDANPQL